MHMFLNLINLLAGKVRVRFPITNLQLLYGQIATSPYVAHL